MPCQLPATAVAWLVSMHVPCILLRLQLKVYVHAAYHRGSLRLASVKLSDGIEICLKSNHMHAWKTTFLCKHAYDLNCESSIQWVTH